MKCKDVFTTGPEWDAKIVREHSEWLSGPFSMNYSAPYGAKNAEKSLYSEKVNSNFPSHRKEYVDGNI